MFGRKYFQIFHEGYWTSDPKPPPPAWFLIMPSQKDSFEIARWKINELGLPLRRPDLDDFCRGIPFEKYVPNEHTKGEIGNFLNAINLGEWAYDYDSVAVLRPQPNYLETRGLDQWLAKVRRSVNLRTELSSWLR
jgi:hypothetical protein